MARKKTITKEQILNAAYDIVASEGFSRLTARNIASKMKCSTQPIYLEFKNMEDLKNGLFERVKGHLEKDVFSKIVTGNSIIDMCLNYIQFASEEKTLYRALFIEEHSSGDKLNEFSYVLFMEKLEKEDKLKVMNSNVKEALFSGTWIVATGIASLKSGGLINPSEEQVIGLMNDVIESVIANDDNKIMTKHVEQSKRN